MESTTDHDRNSSDDGRTETINDSHQPRLQSLHNRPPIHTTTGKSSPAQSMFSETSVSATAPLSTAVPSTKSKPVPPLISTKGKSVPTLINAATCGMIIQNPSNVLGQGGGISPLVVSPFTHSSSQSTTSASATEDDHGSFNSSYQPSNRTHTHREDTHIHANNNNHNNHNNLYKSSSQQNAMDVSSAKNQTQDSTATNEGNGLTVIVEVPINNDDEEEMVTYW